MKFLKNKITRIVAFAAACVIVAVCAFKVTDTLLGHEELLECRWENDYLSDPKYSTEANELYSQLWLVGNMYLRWFDDDGNFTGSPELKASTELVLKELGYMDSEGRLSLYESDFLEYYVSYNDAEFSDTGKSFSELYNYEYSLVYRNNGIENWPQNLVDLWGNDCHWYSTNYGMYYYYSNGRGAAVFDYDTSGLDSYVDEHGARIYYKTDGTTPIPFTDEYDSYTETEPPTEPEMAVQDETDAYSEPEGGFLFYNSDEGKWISVNNDDFIKFPGDESPLKICITPTASVIAAHEAEVLAYNEHMNDFVHSLVNLIPLAVIVLILLIYIIAAGGYSLKEGRFVLGKFDRTVFAELPVVLIIAAFLGGAVLVTPEVISVIMEFMTEYYDSTDMLPVFYSAAYTILFAVILSMFNSLVIRLKCRSFWKTALIGRIVAMIYSKLKKVWKEIRTSVFSREMLRNDILSRRFLIRLVLLGAAGIIFIAIAVDCGMPIELMVVCMLLLLALYAFLNLRDFRDIRKLGEQISAMNGGDYSKREVPEGSVIHGMTQRLNNISDGIQTAVERQVKSERMKIDLVTNVSHDLKTPLTSIISYINLLSMEELSPEARDYVTILEQKSERLRAIVSDLFDLAKATSRTDIQLEMIDAVILINQVLGDMSDRINSFGKEIRTDISMESAPIFSEGRKLYRVLQNLIDNALKYSLDGTRIYLKLCEDEGTAVITLKNISSYEMKFAPEEITERFARGDESRTSEGNGLGLSIAKSFTEACGGEFTVSIDGDVFAAEVRLPLLRNQ